MIETPTSAATAMTTCFVRVTSATQDGLIATMPRLGPRPVARSHPPDHHREGGDQDQLLDHVLSSPVGPGPEPRPPPDEVVLRGRVPPPGSGTDDQCGTGRPLPLAHEDPPRSGDLCPGVQILCYKFTIKSIKKWHG